MSYEFDIIPLQTKVVTVESVLNRMKDYFSLFELNDCIIFRQLSSDYDLKLNDIFKIEEMYQIIGLDSLAITISFDELDADDPDYSFDILDDYARNLLSDEISTLAEAWKDQGYVIKISLCSGKSEIGTGILKAIILAFASEFNGRVLLTQDNIVDLTIGVYSPTEFSKTNFVTVHQ